jgi:alkylated DNA repair dioxygenase AlkB
LSKLKSELRWQQREIVLFGRRVMQPRLVAWYGDQGAQYRYSGVTLEPLPWHPLLDGLRERLSIHCGTGFNSVLANAYRDGRDRMGWHRDDEKELGPEPVIASLSLGQERYFLLRRDGAARSDRILLENGSLLVMRGRSQAEYRHSLPASSRPMKWRINLTYRCVLNQAGD